MPSKTKTKNAAIAARTAVLPKIPKELLDQVVAGGAPMTAEQINATTMALKKAWPTTRSRPRCACSWPRGRVRRCRTTLRSAEVRCWRGAQHGLGEIDAGAETDNGYG